MRAAAAALVCALGVPAAAAQELTDTRAFEQAYAESYYRFDACGDAVTGDLYRRALSAKVASCPFAAAARTRFEERAKAQATQSQKQIQHMIEEHGGMPVKLDGMTRTCREQIESPDYQALRTQLEPQGGGLPAACDGSQM